MVDIHCHIIPNVDDGSKNMEQSIQMAKEALDAGFDTLCCSSHYMIPNYVSKKENNGKILNDFKRELKNNNINLNLKLSNEIFINESIIELLNDNSISTIEGTEYILVELPMSQEIKSLDDIFYNIQNEGYQVILAHPERYSYIQKNPNMLIDFIEQGIILQCNYASILGKYGNDAKKTFIKLLKSKMVNLLATDTHRDKSIYTKMDEINYQIKKIVNDEYFEILTEINPRRILENDEIELLNYKKIKKFFF